MSNDKRFIPVCTPYLNGNETKYVLQAVNDGWISSSGEFVWRFETAFAEYCNVKYGVSVCNGTMALHLALLALGIREGDEVIMPAFTMIASAFAICYTGAVPVFVDADPITWNIDTNLIESKVTSKTKAIMAVHIFGNPCNMDKIKQIAQKYDLYVIEDAAEAHGAEYKGRKVGGLSDIAAFSFFANKNITTGEGGMCVTDSDDLDEKCRYYKNMCFPVHSPRIYIHDEIGYNYRMSNLHAALGLAQTEKADEYRKMRVRNYELYKDGLNGCPGILLQTDEADSLNVHWMNAVVVDKAGYGHDRDELRNHLKSKGIDTRLLFCGMSHQPSLQKYGCDSSGEYPVTDWLTENGLYLPSASSLNPEDIKYICDTITEYAEM